MRPQPDAVLGGRYRLLDRIAVGGMGEVWRARDDVLGREVAVKVLKEEYTGDPGFVERFRAEARHSAALTHPNIAGTYDYGEEEHSTYLVMELVPGEPMSDLLAREGPLAPRRALDLLAQAARGLSAAHAVGVVHRDVKPGNLLVTPDGQVKVTDFGIARAVDAAPLTATGQVMGTAQYLAPEQASGGPSTPASDVYALGVVAYEALTGSRPFDGGSQVAVALQHVNDPPPPLPDDVPAGVRELVERSLAKDPADRPADAGEFAEAAEALAAGTDLPAQPVTTPPTPPTAPLPASGSGVGDGAAATPLTTRPPRGLTWPLVALVALVGFVVTGALVTGANEDTGAVVPGDTPVATTGTPTGPAPSEPPVTTPPPTEAPADEDPEPATSGPSGLEISADELVGQDFETVKATLEGLGLKVERRDEKDTDAQKGTVVAVSEGTFAAGDTVTVVVADPRPQPDEGNNPGKGNDKDEDN